MIAAIVGLIFSVLLLNLLILLAQKGGAFVGLCLKFSCFAVKNVSNSFRNHIIAYTVCLFFYCLVLAVLISIFGVDIGACIGLAIIGLFFYIIFLMQLGKFCKEYYGI